MRYFRFLIAAAIIWTSLAGLIGAGPVRAGEGPSMPIRVAILYHSGLPDYAASGDLYQSTAKVLAANRIPCDGLDVAGGQHYTFLDGENPAYSSIVISTPGDAIDTANSAAILNVAGMGVGAVALRPECQNPALAPLFGITRAGSSDQLSDSLNMLKDEFTFAYSGWQFRDSISLLDHAISEKATVVARDGTHGLPGIWTCTFTGGARPSRTVFFNNDLTGSLHFQGVLLQGILYSMPVGLSSPAAAGAIDVDDCERSYYDSANIQAYHYDFVTNFIRFLDAYNMDASVYVAFSYSDAGSTDAFWAFPESVDGVYRFLAAGHEVGLHCGQAHNPLREDYWGNEAAIDAEVDAMVAAVAELRTRLQDQYSIELPEVVSYVAPMEIMGDHGYQSLDSRSSIEYVGVHYSEDYSEAVTCRDVGLEAGTGIYNLPRAQGDFFYFTRPATDEGYGSWATLRSMIESGQPYIIFTHPDEQTLVEGYSPTMAEVFGGYTTWADSVAADYPFYRWTTAGELGRLLRSRSGCLDARWYPDQRRLQVANVGQDQSLQVKTPLYLQRCMASGETMDLLFSETPSAPVAPGHDVVKTGRNYTIHPDGEAQRLPAVPGSPFVFQSPVPWNSAPVLLPVGDRSTEAGSALSFSLTATDPDGDSLAWSASGLPDGASFDPRTGRFSWTPAAPGVYLVHFEVRDAMAQDWEDILVTVGPLPQREEHEITCFVSDNADDGFSGPWAYSRSATWYEAGQPYRAWFRFTGVDLPDSAVVLEAHLELVQGAWDAGTRLKISAEKAPSPTAPVSTADHCSRVRTTAAVEWSPDNSDWDWHATPDISRVIQELVNSYDYGSNAAIQVLVDDNQGAPGATHVGGTCEGGFAPRLHIRYRAAPAMGAAIVTQTNDSDGICIPAGSPITWTYAVTNTGEVPLSGITVTDDRGVTPLYVSGDRDANGLLDLTETWVYRASGMAVEGQYSNTGTASGTGLGFERVSATDTSSYVGLPVLPVPDLISPANGAVIGDQAPVLDWSDVTGPATMHYQLELDDDADFGSPEVSHTWVSDSFYTVTARLADGAYYWRVRAVDSSGSTSAWTAPWQLTLARPGVSDASPLGVEPGGTQGRAHPWIWPVAGGLAALGLTGGLAAWMKRRARQLDRSRRESA